MMRKSVATILAMGAIAIAASACVSGDPRTFNGGPVGGIVQQHGGENPTPIIFPRSY